MNMKRRIIFVVLVMLAGMLTASAERITSPNGKLALDVFVDKEGRPFYSLDYKGKQLIKPSALGLVADETLFDKGFRVVKTDTLSVKRSWNPVWGEYSEVEDNFRELAVNLKADQPERELTLRFRLFDDGLGFRYELPRQKKDNYLTLRDELTQFNYNGDHTLFCIPGDYDTDEYLWSETTFSK